MSEIVYFELNNWCRGADYPDCEPFISWIKSYQFDNEYWIKENKLVVVRSVVDLSANWCITATKEWIDKNLPLDAQIKLAKFMRYPEVGETEIYGRFDTQFLEYLDENIGWHFDEDDDEM